MCTCETCFEFQDFLTSNENITDIKSSVLLRKGIDGFSNYLLLWSKRQCFCMFTDIKNFERLSTLTHEIIYSATIQIKLLLKEVNENNSILKKDVKKFSRDELSNEDKEKLFHLVAKVFQPNFPLYVAFKHAIQSRIDDFFPDANAITANLNLFSDIHDPEMTLYLMKNVNFFYKFNGVADITSCFHHFGPDKLPIPIAYALCSIVNNLKRWITSPKLAEHVYQLKSKVSKYLCKLSDQDLRLDQVKNMADFMWRDSINSLIAVDVDGLNLALKYFNSSTLTMRLYGITQINNQISLLAEICTGSDLIKESDESPAKMADWLIDNNIILQIFGPNLHVEVIKQSHIILSFLAMEKRIAIDHINTIWQAAQLKHCSKTVYDLLLTFIKNLGIAPILHLYNLLSRLEPKDHTEQTLFVASTLIRFIWSRGNLSVESRFIPFKRPTDVNNLPKCTTSSDNSAVSIDASNSEDEQADSSGHSDSHKSDDEELPNKSFKKRFRLPKSITKNCSINSELDDDSSTGDDDDDDDDEDDDRSSCKVGLLNTKPKDLSIKNYLLNQEGYKGPIRFANIADSMSMDCVISSSTTDVDDNDKDLPDGTRIVLKRPKSRKNVKCKRSKSNNYNEPASDMATDSESDSSTQFKPKVDLAIRVLDVNKNLTLLDDSSSSNEISKEIVHSDLQSFLPKIKRIHRDKLMDSLSGDDGEHDGDNEADGDGSFSSQMSNKSEKNMADFDEESVCEEEFTKYALQAQLASEQVELANKSETPLRFDSNAVSCFNIDNVCQAGNTLIWDLLQDHTIEQLCENIVLEAEKILTNLLCYNCDKNIRVKFIEGCLQNLAINRSVIISLRLLPKLFASFQQFRNIESHQLIDWAEREHQMMSLFFSNLKTYCVERQTSDRSVYTHLMQIQVRLFFLTQIFSLLSIQSSLRLTISHIDILWECLADDSECSDELFSWFLTQLKGSDYRSIDLDGIEHVYVNLLPNLKPEKINMTCLGLLQHLCNFVKSSNHISRFYGDKRIRADDSSGVNYMWSVALRASSTDVSMSAIQYINCYYMGHQLEHEKQFVSQCMSHLKEASEFMKTSEEFNSSVQRLQRCLLVLKSHLDTFLRRYAYHLRRWKLEGQGIERHVPKNDKNSTKLNVIVQPASTAPRAVFQMLSTDYVADLRAEVTKWWEAVIQSRQQDSDDNLPNIMLPDSTIRLISQGHELPIEADEKTLSDVGIKDNTLVFISVAVVRNFKKWENFELPSILPPPPRECIPTLLLTKTEYFEQLFDLMYQLHNNKVQLAANDVDVNTTKMQILSRNVWDIVTCLPTNPILLESFKELKTDISDLLDSKNLQKLLYSLHIIESLSKSQNLEKYEVPQNEIWRLKFIENGGFKHLYDILMSKVLQTSPIYKNEWAQDCLTFVLKLIYQLGICNPPPETISTSKSLRKEKCVPIFDKNLLSTIKVKEAVHFLIKIMDDISQPYEYDYYRTSIWGRDQLIIQIMSLIVSWLKTTNEIRAIIIESKSLIDLLIKLIIDDPDVSVRSETSSAIYNLCLGHTDKKEPADFELTMIMLSELLKCLNKAEAMRLKKNDLHYEDAAKDSYGPACREYFWLLSRLVDGLSKNYVQDCLENPKNHLVDFNELVIRVKNYILSREFLEKRYSTNEDYGLIGLLNLLSNLLKHKPAFLTSHECTEFVGQVFDLLFGLPTSRSRNLPKCKSVTSRMATYDLLAELVKGVPNNYTALHTKLLGQHMPTSRSPYPWDYWPHDDCRSDTGYVGLINLGATCYMASCLQHVFMMPKVRRAVLRANLAEADPKHIEVLRELQKMFTFFMESEKKSYNPRNFCKVYTMDNQPLNTGEQKDMAEFFIDLISKLEEMSPELKSVSKDVFCGVLSNDVVSLDCSHVSRNVEDFYTVRCQVADMRNLYESLNEVTVKDTLEGDNMYTCSQCGTKVRAEKRACFKRLPEILCFNTMRYTFNMGTMLKEKVNTHFSFPMRLNMEGYMEKHLMPQHYKEELLKKQDQPPTSNSEQYEYDLIGVTVHTGNADGGHYYSFIKERTTNRDRWLLFNDAEVKPFDVNLIPHECFGGEGTTKSMDPDKVMDFSFEKTNSAYMLFYERCRHNSNVTTETAECAATSARSGSISPANSVGTCNFELNQDLDDWILNDNMQFIRDKYIFDHTYFNFLWQICGVIPQSILPLQPNITELATQLSTSFFTETFIHSKEKPTTVQWVELITKQFNACQNACKWFLDHMVKDTWWLVQVLIKCPNQMVRQMFQRLCIHVIQRLRPTQRQLYLSFDGDNGDTDMDKPTLDEIPLNIEADRIGNASCVTRFIKSLLSLMEHGAKVHLKNLTEYFSFLFEFSRMGDEEAKFLIAVGAIHMMVQFYLGNKLNDLNELSDMDEEEEEVIAVPQERHKPASLDKMVTLIASLVEKSRNSAMKLQLSTKDYSAIVGGKGVPYIYHQIKDNINLQQTKNLIHSLCKDNEQLAIKIVGMLSQVISSTRNSEMTQTVFKIFTLITEVANGGSSSDNSTSPCFTQLVLQKVWEAADFCPQSILEWLSVQVTRNKLVHQWLLQSMNTWVEHFLIAHSNQRVRASAAYLILSLIPNLNFRQTFRNAHRSIHREQILSDEALSILHQIYTHLLKLLSNAKTYADTQAHGTSKLTSYFSLMTYFLISNTEKLMLVEYFENLWTLYHPLLSEPPISTYHNKQALLVYWYNACVDCPENVQCILQNEQVLQHLPFNYIYADHDNQDVILFNRTMLPAYYGLLRLCCESSREFNRSLANHSNLNWAFTNIAPHPTQYSAAVDELFRLMSLFVKAEDDATEQELKEIKEFKHESLISYLKGLDGRTSWSTVISAFQILVTTIEDSLFVINNNGLHLLFDTFQTLHMMYHEATACHVTTDILELLSLIVNLMFYLRNYCVPKESRSLILDYKDWFDIVKKMTTLLNTFNSHEMRTLCINIIKEFVLIIPNEVINLLVPLLSHCHNTHQHTHSTLLLGPYFPKRGESVPSPTAKNIPRATRPMLQMAIPHSQIELGISIDYDTAIYKLYAPYHEFIDLICRIAININCFSETMISLSSLIGYESTYLHMTYFPQLWLEIYRNKEHGRNYVDTLVRLSSFVEYVDAIVLDDRKCLVVDCLFDFMTYFLPKVAKKIITKQSYEVLRNIRLSLEKVANSLNERNVVLNLIGDLRTLFLFNSNSETIADVTDFKKTLININNKLTELTGTTVNEGYKPEIGLTENDKTTDAPCSSSQQQLVRKIVTINVATFVDGKEFLKSKRHTMTVEEGWKLLQMTVFDHLQLIEKYENKMSM